MFFELSDEGYIAIPIIIDCKNDYLDAHSYIVNQIFNKTNDYRDFEPVVTFTKEYIYKIINEQEEEEIEKLYDEFQEELEDAYHNSDSYINKYKEEIKNNIEIMYEEFCNLYPDLSDKYTDMRNLCDEYIAKVDASIYSIILENLYTEFQEKYYNYINGLFD